MLPAVKSMRLLNDIVFTSKIIYNYVTEKLENY